jgi:signal transduction histidine kinase
MFLLLGALGQEAVFAQKLFSQHYGRLQGLPSDYINHIFQDRKGFLWFATDKGLSRYDGKNFFTLNVEKGLPNNMVYCSSEDPQGALWLGLYEAGACRYDGQNLQIYDAAKGLKHSVKYILHDAHGRSYFFDGYQLSILDKDGLIKYKKLESKLPAQWAMGLDGEHLFIWNAQKAWKMTATAGGVFWKELSWTSAAGARLQTSPQLKMLRPKDAQYLYTNESLLLRIDKDSLRFVPYTAPLPAAVQVPQLPAYVKTFLKSNDENTFLQDYEGNFWVASFGRGVQKFVGNYQYSYPQVQDEIDGAWIPHPDTAYLAGKKGLYVLIKGEVRTFKALPNVRAVLRLPKPGYHFLVGTFEDLQYWEANSPTLESVQLRQRFDCPTGVADLYAPDAATWWIATYGSGLIRQKNGRSDTLSTAQGLVSNRIEGLMRSDKALWASSLSKGLSRVEMLTGAVKNFSTENGLLSNTVFCVFERADGSLWVGSEKGLTCFDSDWQVRYFTAQEGLVGKRVMAVFEGPRQEIYVLSDKSLHLLQGKRLQALGSFQLFANGQTILNKAYYKAEWQCLYLATNQGLLVLDIRQALPKSQVPKFELTYLRQDSVQIPIQNQHYQIPYTIRNIRIDFAALSFLNEQGNRFAYRLAGYQSEWQSPQEEAFVQFQNLPHGAYILEAKAIGPDGVASDIKRLYFEIETPFWYAWWFLLLWGLLSLAAVVAVVRYFAQRKLKKRLEQFEMQHRLQKERERIARDLHDNVGAQLSYIVSGIEQVQGQVQEDKKSKIERIGFFARQSIAQLRETIWAMNQEQISLENFETKLRDLLWHYQDEGQAIECQLQISLDEKLCLEPTQALHLYRIIQESVSNCFKHSQAKRLLISLRSDAQAVLYLSIEDDGVGFYWPQAQKNGHYGLVNLQARAEEIKAVLEIQSAPQQGTRISLQLPPLQKYAQ